MKCLGSTPAGQPPFATIGSKKKLYGRNPSHACSLFRTSNYPKKLEAAKLTEPESSYQYARGKIVIWVPNDSKIDISSGLQSLMAPTVKKIAIANPQHAPYGQAAVRAMQKEGVYDNVKDKLVLIRRSDFRCSIGESDLDLQV